MRVDFRAFLHQKPKQLFSLKWLLLNILWERLNLSNKSSNFLSWEVRTLIFTFFLLLQNDFSESGWNFRNLTSLRSVLEQSWIILCLSPLASFTFWENPQSVCNVYYTLCRQHYRLSICWYLTNQNLKQMPLWCKLSKCPMCSIFGEKNNQYWDL